tara:strand:+ start:295 stop:942 length:648 start_codon:yes stop_codon:yes gene_type:complete
MDSQGDQVYTSFFQQNLKEIGFLLLFGAIAGAAYYFFSSKKSTEITPFEEIGVLDLNQITISDYHLENQKWKLEGDRAIISEKTNLMRIEKVKIWVFTNDNASLSSSSKLSNKKNVYKNNDIYIIADQGLIEKEDNRVTISGNVILVHDDGSEIRTDTAIYDAKKDSITIPKPVRVIREGYTMLGSDLIYSISEGKVNLNNPVMLKFGDKPNKTN